MEAGDWIAILGLMAGLFAFGTGLFQYGRAQKWKKAEFVVKEIKEFEKRQAIRDVKAMLDWNARYYDVGTDDDDEDADGSGQVFIDDEMLVKALVPHEERPEGFSPAEVFIRDSFDMFLDNLERFEHFIQSGLVSHYNFRPYLLYDLRLIANPKIERKPQEFYDSLWSYMARYRYIGVVKLCARFGFDVRRPSGLSKEQQKSTVPPPSVGAGRKPDLGR